MTMNVRIFRIGPSGASVQLLVEAAAVHEPELVSCRTVQRYQMNNVMETAVKGERVMKLHVQVCKLKFIHLLS